MPSSIMTGTMKDECLNDPLYFFDESASGLMARATDWSTHSLGPAKLWPVALKTLLGLLFRQTEPALLLWGRQASCFYNDAFLNILAFDERPKTIGAPAAATLPILWRSLQAPFESALSTRKTTRGVDRWAPSLGRAGVEGHDGEFACTPVFSDSGHPLGAMVNGRLSVTSGRKVRSAGLNENSHEHKINERKLKETLAFLEAITKTSTDAIYIKDLESRMIYGNPATFHSIGRPAEEVIGKNDVEALGPGRGGEEIIANDRQIMRSGQLQIIEEWVGESSDRRIFQSNKAPYRDANGKILGLIGISRDITEQRRAIEALRRSEATLATILDRLPVGVVVANPAGDILQFNQKVLDIWGGCQKVGIDRYSDFEGYWLDSGKRIAFHEWALARAIIKKESVLNEVIRIRAFDGKEKILLNSALPIYTDGGGLIGAIAVMQDITEQKRLEQELRSAKDAAEAANEMKSAFLANMSHEIRTPLGALLGFADLLRETQLGSEERENYHKIIKRNGEQLSGLINDILDLSKIEAGQLKTEILRSPIRHLIEEVRSLLSVKAQDKNLELRFLIDRDVPEWIGTDPLRLSQILTNVVANAIKFTKRGSVALHVAVKDERTLNLTVSDTGIGIAPEQIHNLFKPFSQADTSITRRYGGTGLGLTLSRRLAHALGGDLVLKSSCVGVGSIFEITIKDQWISDGCVDPHTASPSLTAASLSDEREKLKGLRLLLVEDSPDNQMLVSQIMKRYGAELELANNGREGVERAMRGEHDLILMDIQMPVMDGYTATQTLREQGYQKPIIALTAHAMNEVRKKCLNIGCNDQLTKPIRRDELIHIIAQYADRRF